MKRNEPIETGPHRTKRVTELRSSYILICAASFFAILGGCGNLTAGGASEVEVVVASDDSQTGSEASSTSGGNAFAVGSDLVPLEGSLTLDLEVTLVDSDGSELVLTGGVQPILVGLSRGSRVSIALSSVPAGEYEAVRATFHRVAVEATSAPGVGLPLEFELDLPGGAVEIESTSGLPSFDPDERVRIVLDMRVGVWVLTPAGERLQRFLNAVTFEIEPGG